MTLDIISVKLLDIKQYSIRLENRSDSGSAVPVCRLVCVRKVDARIRVMAIRIRRILIWQFLKEREWR